MTNKSDLATISAAVITLARDGELELLPHQASYLIDAWGVTMKRILDWHRAHGGGPVAWCWTCGELKERGHKC
jgi:hypothetical protein